MDEPVLKNSVLPAARRVVDGEVANLPVFADLQLI
jgi:hypothetical protein